MRVLGVEISEKKVTYVAIQAIYGIGESRAKKICDALAINRLTRFKDLGEANVDRIIKYIEENYTIEGDLKNSVREAKKRLIRIKCYRGIRLSKGLPIKARTKTNCKTVRLLKKRGKLV